MKRPLLRFAVLFFLALIGFSVLSVLTNLQNHLAVLEGSIAAAAGWMAQAIGSNATVVDNLISVSGMTLNINHECTGVFVFFVLTSFIAAYPARWRAKLLGVAVGIAILTTINVVRIATLVRVVESYPQAFMYFHEYVWQGAFLMLTTLYAITWVEWTHR